MNLSIVIPCYNEEKNVKLIVNAFEELNMIHDIELILVDNGSEDKTREKILEEAKKFDFIKTVIVEKNQGYGYGILKGLETAKGEYAGWMHADMQVNPNVLKNITHILKANNTKIFIKGVRRNRPFIDTIFTMCMGIYETIYMGLPLWDINAQPVLFPTKFLDVWNNPPFDFSLDLYAFCKARMEKYKVIRFDVLHQKRQHGTSSWNIGILSRIKLIDKTLKYSKNLKRELQLN